MKTPAPLTCLINEWDRRCPHPTCDNYIAPVEGDVLRRNMLCSRAVEDVAVVMGGLEVKEIGWLLGVCSKTIQRTLGRALAKMRRRVGP